MDNTDLKGIVVLALPILEGTHVAIMRDVGDLETADILTSMPGEPPSALRGTKVAIPDGYILHVSVVLVDVRSMLMADTPQEEERGIIIDLNQAPRERDGKLQ